MKVENIECGMRVIVTKESVLPQFQDAMGQCATVTRVMPARSRIVIRYDEHPSSEMYIESDCVEPYEVKIGDMVVVKCKSCLLFDTHLGSIGRVTKKVDSQGDIRVKFCNDGNYFVERKNVSIIESNDELLTLLNALKDRK